MIVYGYAIEYSYAGTGQLMIKVRIPNIHGPYNQREYRGQKVKNYTSDENLPWYPSLLLPHLPNNGEVVALLQVSDSTSSDFLVIGLTGGQYSPVDVYYS